MKDGVVAAEKEVEELNEMEPSERQALRLVEDLTLPSVCHLFIYFSLHY